MIRYIVEKDSRWRTIIVTAEGNQNGAPSPVPVAYEGEGESIALLETRKPIYQLIIPWELLRFLREYKI